MKLELPKDRTVFLTGEIEASTAKDILEEVLTKDNSSDSIYLVINSCGGDEEAARMIYLTLKNCLKSKLVTVAAGEIASAATIIYCAGQERLAFKSSSFYVHAGTIESAINLSEIKSYYRANSDKSKALSEIYAESSNIKAEKWQKLILKSKNFSYEEMLKYGITTREL